LPQHAWGFGTPRRKQWPPSPPTNNGQGGCTTPSLFCCDHEGQSTQEYKMLRVCVCVCVCMCVCVWWDCSVCVCVCDGIALCVCVSDGIALCVCVCVCVVLGFEFRAYTLRHSIRPFFCVCVMGFSR
jgi:hypothetical protein